MLSAAFLQGEQTEHRLLPRNRCLSRTLRTLEERHRWPEKQRGTAWSEAQK